MAHLHQPDLTLLHLAATVAGHLRSTGMSGHPRASSDRDVRDRSFWWLVAAAVGFALFSAAWIATHPGHDPSCIALDDISETVAPLVAAAVCFLAARNPRATARVAWVLIGSRR